MNSTIIDSHVHPDLNSYGSALESAKYLHKSYSHKVNHMVLIALKELGCDNQALGQVAMDASLKPYFSLAGCLETVTIDHARFVFEKYYETKQFRVLKLHPRIQKFRMTDPVVFSILKDFEKFELPVLVDCFHDGNQMLHGDPLKELVSAAEKFPKIQFIMAHSGGFELMRAMTFAKTFKNIHLDFSYSLLYYRESSLRQDIGYVLKSMRGDRVLFGTDYPDRAYDSSLAMSSEVLSGLGLSDEHLEKFMFKNAQSLFGLS